MAEITETFDLVCLGGGPAGCNAAEKAAEAGLKVCVIERNAPGGVCLYEGCIPSKSLLHSAKICSEARNASAYGVDIEGARINHAAVIERKNNAVASIAQGISLAMKRLKITVIKEKGFILGRDESGIKIKAGEEEITARNLIVATGSAPVIPGIPGVREGLQSGFVLTAKQILDLTVIPAKLTVIGAGAAGLEMAAYFRCAGSEVTVIEKSGRIAGGMDRKISSVLQRNLAAKGIDLKLGCSVTAIENGCVVYEDSDGSEFRADASYVLLSVGRKPVINGFGLENLGIETSGGAIVTDEFMRTGVMNVYAAGDVNGRFMLAHTAYREGEVAVNNILGKSDRMRYNAVPSVIYTGPEAASVGMTLEEARSAGIDADETTVPMNRSGRYALENECGNGLAKIVYDKEHRRVIGVHLVGSYVSEMIYGAAMMIESEAEIDQLRKIIFPHPTVSEVIREALFEI